MFTVDDAHLIASNSWHFMSAFGTQGGRSRSMLVLAIRTPWHQSDRNVAAVIDAPSALKISLTPMGSQHLAALACQLLTVQMIPQRLDRMLRLNSMGVSSWVDLLLREYLYENVIKVCT